MTFEPKLGKGSTKHKLYCVVYLPVCCCGHVDGTGHITIGEAGGRGTAVRVGGASIPPRPSPATRGRGGGGGARGELVVGGVARGGGEVEGEERGDSPTVAGEGAEDTEGDRVKDEGEARGQPNKQLLTGEQQGRDTAICGGRGKHHMTK